MTETHLSPHSILKTPLFKEQLWEVSRFCLQNLLLPDAVSMQMTDDCLCNQVAGRELCKRQSNC